MGEKNIKIKRLFFWSALTFIFLTVIITIITLNSRPLSPCSVIINEKTLCVILDAGHGGLDGGAVSPQGTVEANINLMISKKTRDFMNFFGITTIMTRTEDISLNYNPNKSTRDNKNADLRARLDISSCNTRYEFLSVHLNKFEQSQYYGAQVFYGKQNSNSRLLAECIQKSFVENIDSSNKRTAKQCHDSVYLMKNISSPAVIVECGFLSNPNEEALLCSNNYQTQIAIAITKGYIDYKKDR